MNAKLNTFSKIHGVLQTQELILHTAVSKLLSYSHALLYDHPIIDLQLFLTNIETVCWVFHQDHRQKYLGLFEVHISFSTKIYCITYYNEACRYSKKLPVSWTFEQFQNFLLLIFQCLNHLDWDLVLYSFDLKMN